MPTETKETEVDQLATQIFCQRAATIKVATDTDAVAAYRAAEILIRTRARIKAGEFTVIRPPGPQLEDCCAPNLKPTHPINMISQRFGDLARVAKINTWLAKNGGKNVDEDDLLSRLNREFTGLDWDHAALHHAQVIFPPHCAA